MLTNTTSIGKRIKKVCTDWHGFKTRALPLLKTDFPNRPFIRLIKVSAIWASSLRTIFLLKLIIFISAPFQELRLLYDCFISGFENFVRDTHATHTNIFNKGRSETCSFKMPHYFPLGIRSCLFKNENIF